MQDGTTVLVDVGMTLAQEKRALDRFIAHRIFPGFGVKTKQGNMPRILARRRVQTVKRNKDGSFNRVESAADELSYSCEGAGLEERLPDEDRVHFSSAFDAEFHVALGIQRDLLRSRDVALSTALFTTGTFGAGYNAAAIGTWGGGSSNPLKDVELGKEEIRKRLGVFPNKMAIGAALWAKASYDPAILAQVKTLRAYAGDIGANRSRIPLEVLADVFGLEEIIVGEEVKDTSAEGQSSSLSDIWAGTFGLLFYGTNTPENMGDVTLGRTLTWNPYLEQSTQGSDLSELDAELLFIVDKYRENKTKADIIRVEEFNTMKLLNKDAGYLLTGC
jgi:hypothetical protein